MSLLQKMQDAMVKLEKLIYFTGAEEDGTDLRDLLLDHGDDAIAKSFSFDLEELESRPDLAISLEDAGYTGYFFANAHTPIRKHHNKGSHGYGYSWGYTTYTLVFAKSFEDLVDKAVEWAKGKQEEMKSEGK